MWDEHGYFVTPKYSGGNDIQNDHPKRHNPSTIHIPIRLFYDEEEEIVKHWLNLHATRQQG